MPRAVLIHWNEKETAERLRKLRAAGYSATAFSSEDGGPALKALTERPPDVFVIDLSRLPSHGREIAIYLRGRKSTRAVPLVFVDGEPAKVARVRKLLPDAEYCAWRGVRGAMTRARARAPTEPCVPGPMASYSETPLPRKLGIKPGSLAVLIDAPNGFEQTLGTLPDGAATRRGARGRGHVVLLFAPNRRRLERRFETAIRCVRNGGSIWICWPKRSSGVRTDLTQSDVRRYGLDRSWVDYKIAAIDDTWSGLRFARRR